MRAAVTLSRRHDDPKPQAARRARSVHRYRQPPLPATELLTETDVVDYLATSPDVAGLRPLEVLLWFTAWSARYGDQAS